MAVQPITITMMALVKRLKKILRWSSLLFIRMFQISTAFMERNVQCCHCMLADRVSALQEGLEDN